MTGDSATVVVVGAGAFGASSALELRRRGHEVLLMDPGPLPHPLASSTDISKMIRMDYGDDAFYMELMEKAFPIWRAWNRGWGEELYHETGFLLLAEGPMEPGGFEYESLQLLERRGHPFTRLDSAALSGRIPAWRADRYPDGYINPEAGWAESGRVVERLVADARQAGVQLLEGRRMKELDESGGAVRGVVTSEGETIQADWVVVAAGAWTPKLLPQLADVMWPVGQPVLHFKVADPAAFQLPHFLPWSADIANTGWYGFSALADGTLKIANHGPGRRVDPDEPRTLDAGTEAKFRAFLRDSLPTLAEAPLVGSRLCLYCDTWDGNFWIDRDPVHERLIVAAGGSGHGFKFTPVIGPIVADLVEGKENRFAWRFAWRSRGALDTEHARHT